MSNKSRRVGGGGVGRERRKREDGEREEEREEEEDEEEETRDRPVRAMQVKGLDARHSTQTCGTCTLVTQPRLAVPAH